MEVAFIGNFKAPFSTENDRKWSLRMLGVNVIIFQENETTAEQLLSISPDALFYSHTHDPSYCIDGLVRVFEEYKSRKIPTVSIHLDLWSGLARSSDVGQEATWFTQYLFMADGSPDAEDMYNKFSLNWFYSAGAVVARDCYMPPADPVKFPHEIVFIGSKGYHPEYPFRPQLVEWLHKTYGNRFGHYGPDGLGTVRGHDLNVLCSTAKIIVGDSCFGGKPYYVSDRYYETRGRGGFLLHPHWPGMDTEGVAHYEPQNLNSLQMQIEYFLRNDQKREELRLRGFNHVKNNETYTHRMREILETIL